MDDVVKLPERSDFEALKEPRHYGMARAALRLPNPNNRAEGNSAHVRFESAQRTWDTFVAAGLARQRQALPYEGATGAVYELTYLGISAVLEAGESRGPVGVSPETDLVPVDGGEVTEQVPAAPGAGKSLPDEAAVIEDLSVPVSASGGASEKTASITSAVPETTAAEAQDTDMIPIPLPKAPDIGVPATIHEATTRLIGRLRPCEPNDPTEWLLEQAAFQAANDPSVPAWAQNVIKALWEEVVNREAWRSSTDVDAPAPKEEKADA